MKDWLIETKIDVSNYKEIIKGIIEKQSPIPKKIVLKNLSTKGENAIQYHLTDHKDLFLDIQKAVVDKMEEYLKHDFNLLQAWTILGQENSYHIAHRHSDPMDINSQNHVATVLYLDVPKENNFNQTGAFYFFVRDDNNNIQSDIIKPEIGTLLIMPTHLYHGTYPQAKGLRQTLNMDFESFPV